MSLEENPITKRILKTHCPLVAFWFPWYWRKSDIAKLRKIAGHWIWQDAKGACAKTILVLKVIVWPLVAVAGLFLSWSIRAKVVRSICGKSKRTQLLEIMYFSFWRGFPPIDYYDKRVYLFKISEVIDNYISGMETTILNLSSNTGEESETVNNKHSFEKHCRQFNLPTMPTIAAFSDGDIFDVHDAFSLPLVTLYYKPVYGLRGTGIERWECDSEKGTWKSEDIELTEENLLLHFKDSSRQETHVLQEVAYNHSELERFSTGGLVTFRVITVLGHESEPETMECYMVMPRGKTPANHGTYGGIVAQMNLENRQFF